MTPATISLRSASGLYVCAEGGGGTTVNASRPAAGEWEMWKLLPRDGNVWAIQSSGGYYLGVDPREVTIDRREVGEWEEWEADYGETDGSVTFRNHYSGLYLRAIDGGGFGLACDRDVAHAHECFMPSEDFLAAPVDPTVRVADPIRGQLGTIAEQGYIHGDGAGVIPAFVHAGDLIGQGLTFGLSHIEPFLDLFAKHNYHGLRSWINVDAPPDDEFWGSKPASCWNILDDPDGTRDIFAAAAARGLRWHVASGGYAGSDKRDEQMFDCLRDLVSDIGPEYFGLIEARNEVRDTGGQSPERLEALINRVRNAYPQILYGLSAYTGTEDREIIGAYTPEWMQLFLIHCYRGGHAWDKIRHRFSDVYDGENGPPVRRLAWRGEPVGVGWPVSATEHDEELDGPTMALIGAMGALRGAWVFMSGPGVILPASVADFEAVAGFKETRPLLAALPQDVNQYDILSHAGDNKQGQRIHAVIAESPDVRADYVINPDTNAYVEIIYGPPDQDQNLPREREATVTVLGDCPMGRVLTGQLV